MLDKFSAEKKKQYMYFAAGAAGLTTFLILVTSVFSNDAPVAEKLETPAIKITNKKDTDAKVFRKESGAEMADMKASIELLKRQLEDKDKEGTSNSQSAGVNLPLQQQSSSILNIPPPPPPPSSVAPMTPPMESKHTDKPVEKTSVVMNDMIANVVGVKDAKDEATVLKNESKKKIDIPSGSFMGGVLLSGVDAPTGGKAKSGPHPILIKIVETAKLPNLFTADLKECHAVGSAYGDLSSERAYIRVEKITCMTKKGEVIEKTKGSSFGYVAGEDGKVGLLGRVVSKQGSMLARTMAAGFLEGVSKGFSQGNTTYSVQPTGTVSTPNPGTVMETGLWSGAAEASKKLADFYMKLANEMFPVIEINAGRKVDIVLLERISFDVEEK